jgi:hypothetical protein
MKDLNFVDPEVVSKQEILYFSIRKAEIAEIEWIDSITNDVVLTSDEARVVHNFLELFLVFGSSNKLDLLFDERFFPDAKGDSIFPYPKGDSELLKRFFRTDLLDDERIKSIPLLFKKRDGDGKEMLDIDAISMIEQIKAHCTQNEEFAEAYRTKLDEIRNSNGPLQERVVAYDYFYNHKNRGRYTDEEIASLIHELEQPVFEMYRKCFNCDTISGNWVLDLLIVSLLQTPDGIQVPRCNEENSLCRRLLLDCVITKKNTGILDKLFRDYTTMDVVLIICNHLKWHKDNNPKKLNLRKRQDFLDEYKAQLLELLSGDILQKYSELFYKYFPKWDKEKDIYISDYLYSYLTEKIASAISENNHEQIRDISRLFENKDWVEKIDGWGEDTYLYKEALERLQFTVSSAMKILESGDHPEKLRNILRDSKSDGYSLNLLVEFLVKNQKNNNSPLSLEDFVQKYIPLDIFHEIIYSHFPSKVTLTGSFFSEQDLDRSFFYEQNEDVYQNIIKKYPGLRRDEALLDRLLPCFAAIVIKNTDEMLAILDGYCEFTPPHDCFFVSTGQDSPKYIPMLQLFLCVFDQLCERHEKEHESITLIFEMIFKYEYCVPEMLDIIKKYPQVQQLIFENCYKILKETWNTPSRTSISSCKIEANVPACIIGMYKGLWHGLKPLLIALRKNRMEWVDEGLDYDNRPNDNNNPVEEIEFYFSFFRESLKSLRQDMATGLSDWLKPLPESKRGNLEKRLAEFPEIEKNRDGFDITYTEPDPIWRYAYVLAIADLGVDVDGRGHYIHSVIDKVAQEDPSEMVRKAAEEVSAELKKLRNGWDGDAHYQKITLAFWWIKQASRLVLNLSIDRKKAMDIRRSLSYVMNMNEDNRWAYYYISVSGRRKQLKYMRKAIVKEEAKEPWEKLMRARLKI